LEVLSVVNSNSSFAMESSFGLLEAASPNGPEVTFRVWKGP
jgi:hypothetical protein